MWSGMKFLWIFLKVCTVQQYTIIAINKPDIIVLNETWLKKSILDNEILDPKFYKIYRLDRSKETHPLDPENIKKIRKNGGGVLIGVSTQLVLTSSIIKIKCRAELLEIEFLLRDKTKMIISTCYRVGTLGKKNLEEVSNAIKTLIRKRGVKTFILIGDFNLPHINWNTHSSNVSLEQDFLNMFAENLLIQSIHTPIRRHGNILDLLLTSSSRQVDNLKVIKESLICKSDHFPITFDIMIRCKRNKGSKCKLYNFKKANWDRLNSELADINWTSLLDSLEPEAAWINFTETLKQHMQRHIPVITVKSEFQPLWFDSECHRTC